MTFMTIKSNIESIYKRVYRSLSNSGYIVVIGHYRVNVRYKYRQKLAECIIYRNFL